MKIKTRWNGLVTVILITLSLYSYELSSVDLVPAQQSVRCFTFPDLLIAKQNCMLFYHLSGQQYLSRAIGVWIQSSHDAIGNAHFGDRSDALLQKMGNFLRSSRPKTKQQSDDHKPKRVVAGKSDADDEWRKRFTGSSWDKPFQETGSQRFVHDILGHNHIVSDKYVVFDKRIILNIIIVIISLAKLFKIFPITKLAVCAY